MASPSLRALLLAKIYECLPLRRPRCGQPMRIIAFILEPTTAPEVLPARAPPQAEFPFTQVAGPDDWPDMDQTAGTNGDTWD